MAASYKTFPATTTSTASARMSVRKADAGAPIESILNETPGHVGMQIPDAIPVTGMSIYPGDQFVLAPTYGAITNYGQDTDPGLVTTYQGFPRQPLVSVQAQTLASTTGEYLSGARDLPQDVDLGTQARWLASELSAGSVGSLDGTELPWSLTTDGAKIAYTYRRIKELFTFSAISLDPGTSITGDFPLSDSNALTVSMVIMLRAPLGYPVFSNDLVTLYANNAWQLSYGGGQTTTQTKIEVSNPTPIFLTIVVNPPTTTVYVSKGPGKTYSFSARTTSPTSVDTDFRIGAIKDVTPVANMEILEVSLDTYARTTVQVEALNSVYGSIYGQG